MWYAFGAGVHARHRVGKDVDSQEASLYIDICRRFSINTGIIAFPAPIPATSDHDFWEKLQTLAAENQSADAVYVHYSWFPDAVEKGMLLDLTPYLADAGLKLDSFYTSAVKQFMKNDRIFAIPRETSSIVTYFNEMLFRDMGIPTPSALYRKNEWSWEEFENITKQLSGNGVFGCVAPITVPYALFPLIYSFGGSVLDQAQTSCKFNDDRTISAIAFARNLIMKGYGITPETAQKENLFNRGKVGIFCSGFWDVAVLNSSDLGFDWDVEHLPRGLQQATRVASGGYGVLSTAAKKQEALRFISFAVQPDQLVELGKSGLIIPADRRAAESPSWLQEGKVPLNRRVFLDALNYGIPDPSIANWPHIIDIINSNLQNVWKGETSASACCNEITKLVNTILRRPRS